MRAKKFLFLVVLAGLMSGEIAFAQVGLNAPAASVENFDGMGAALNLPAGWRFSPMASGTPTYGAGFTTVTQAANAGSPMTGGRYNWGTSAGTDRSAGVMTSGSYGNPNSLMVWYRNLNTSNIVQLQVSYNAERYRINSAAASIQFYYSIDGTTWVPVAAGGVSAVSFPTGPSSYIFGAPTTVSVGPFSITGVSIPQNGSIYMRWNFNTTGTNSQGIGIDDVSVTPVDCVIPDAIRFVTQPPASFSQGTSTPVSVEAYCTVGGARAAGFNGNVTLSLFNGCGFVNQTVAAVNGLATFNVIVTRGPQTGVVFEASSPGFASVNSSSSNVTAPAGAPVSTVLRNQNWDGGTPVWNYTIGSPTVVGSGGTSGIDLFGVVNPTGGNSYLRKSYSVSNTAGALGSRNTATFDVVSGLGAYTDVNFLFRLASLSEVGSASALPVGSGRGNDSGEDLIIEVELNNSGVWDTVLIHSGSNNKVFPFAAAPVDVLAYNAGFIYNGTSTQSAFQVTLPSGTTDFRFRMTATNNRVEENWCIDNIELIGINYPSGTPFPLPIADAGNDLTICPGESAQLSVAVQNSVGTLTYNWTFDPTLSATNIQNPVATPATTTSYTVTITDGDMCTASDVVQVILPTGAAGLWTGAFDDDWFNCKNWGDGVVPTTATNVTIPNAALNPANVNHLSPFAGAGIAYCNNIQITGKPLIIEADQNNILEVHGNLSISGTGNLDMDDGTAAIDGQIFLYGNWTNSLNQLQFAEGQSTVHFVGNANQTLTSTVSSNEVFYNVVANKPGGNIFLVSNMTINTGGTFTFIQGITDALSNNRTVFFIDGSFAVGANANSFVEGEVWKTGNDAFTFPVGLTGWGYRPIGISAPSSTSDVFAAEYIRSSAAALGPISAPGLDHVSACEYWILDRMNGVSTVDVIASYDGTSCGVTSLPDLVIAHFDGSTWDDFGGAGTATGTFAAGTVTWPGVSIFSPFTLASISFQNPLPVELISFTASKKKSKVVCEWVTMAEVNNAYFEVEAARGSNMDFRVIGRVDGNGNTTVRHDYVLTDGSPVQGRNYYRLKQYDFDGKYSISDPVIVNFEEGNSFELIAVAPNPFQSTTRLFIQMPVDGFLEINVINSIGKKIYSQLTEVSAGNFNLLLPLEESLSPGVYFVSVVFEGEGRTVRIIKR